MNEFDFWTICGAPWGSWGQEERRAAMFEPQPSLLAPSNGCLVSGGNFNGSRFGGSHEYSGSSTRKQLR